MQIEVTVRVLTGDQEHSLKELVHTSHRATVVTPEVPGYGEPGYAERFTRPREDWTNAEPVLRSTAEAAVEEAIGGVIEAQAVDQRRMNRALQEIKSDSADAPVPC